MNTHNLYKEAVKIIVFVTAILAIAFFARGEYNDIFLLDEASVGWYWGVFGTLYALVAAFVLVAVWEQYNSFEEAIAKEAKTLATIWNYIDYLDDQKGSQQMEEALTAYITHTTDVEYGRMAKGEKVVQFSKETVKIMRVIDIVEFQDEKDTAAFSGLMNAYEELTHARSSRIEQSVTRVPPLLKLFFQLVSATFIFGYIIHGYNSAFLYYATLGILTLIVSFSYIMINDLDNPFKGIWNISFSALKDTKTYIQQNGHTH